MMILINKSILQYYSAKSSVVLEATLSALLAYIKATSI